MWGTDWGKKTGGLNVERNQLLLSFGWLSGTPQAPQSPKNPPTQSRSDGPAALKHTIQHSNIMLLPLPYPSPAPYIGESLAAGCGVVIVRVQGK